MKTITLFALHFFFSMTSLADNGQFLLNDQGGRYCAKMMDGRLIVMHDGAIMLTEVRFANGTELKPDGSVTSQDGAKSILKEGECLDKNGTKDSGLKESKSEKETRK